MVLAILLPPAELEQLEKLRVAVNEGLPVEVKRADLGRLAVSFLLDMTPAMIRTALAERRAGA